MPTPRPPVGGSEESEREDLHAVLRRQYKPAEMVVLPGGTHQLSAPGDRMMSLQGNLDWFSYWLAGRKRIMPVLASETPESLQQQYRRWDQMETFKVTSDAGPRCVRKTM